MSMQSSALPTLTGDQETWRGASLLSVTQITPDGLNLLFRLAQEMRALVQSTGGDDRLKHCILGTVFFEASTRTSSSFQAAMLRLGGRTIHVDGKGNSSAGQKGESLEDTIRCLECYTDAVVLRHPVQGSVGTVIKLVKKPIINAGDGVGEHPTQALLDVFTIFDELNKAQETKSLTVVMLGDLKHGRTVHSLVKLLVNCGTWSERLTFRYCCPAGLEMPADVLNYVGRYDHVHQEDHATLNDACQGADILYVTRIQRERFETDSEYERVKGSYIVGLELMQSSPPHMLVLHPLPRVDEIDTAIDNDPRAAYFRQMENGLYVRMALLALLLGKGH